MKFKTKAEWAAAKAAELEAAARSPMPDNRTRWQHDRWLDSVAHDMAEARRYQRMAERFRARGE